MVLFVFQGLNVTEELWEIASYTLDLALCTSITEELLRQHSLNTEQVAMVTFFKELIELYPSRNFEDQRDLQHQTKERLVP